MNHWVDLVDGLPEEAVEEAKGREGLGETSAEDYLSQLSLADKDDVRIAKCRFFRLPCIELKGYHASPEATGLIAEEQARKLRIFPLFRMDEIIYVAMSDPQDLRCEDFVRKLTGLRVKPVLADEEDIRQAITRDYLKAQRGTGFVPQTRLDSVEDEDGETEHMVEGHSPAVKETVKVISQAIRLGASDIHLEPDEEQVFLRYRIDGALHDYSPPDQEIYPAVVSRIKILSGLDIAEKRLPQDGRASIQVDGKDYDLRISILPNIYGEGICLRILNPEATKMELSAMGFEEDTLERYDRVISRPHGIVLVTGPTGSGKSTTLYATLRRIIRREIKTITLEDPVEYKLQGIVQVPIRPEIGYTFATGLRAILRHDPDIVMVGEIRDLSSAEIAFKAALTGHLLFSTLHTNSAALAVTRLLDMGVQAFQVMAALNGVLAQRLIRRLCKNCKVPHELSGAELKLLEMEEQTYEIFRAVGCSECQNIGYKGRTAIHEFLEITPEMRRLKEEQMTAPYLESLGQDQGFRTLRQAALLKLRAGVTSVSEVLSVTGSD